MVVRYEISDGPWWVHRILDWPWFQLGTGKPVAVSSLAGCDCGSGGWNPPPVVGAPLDQMPSRFSRRKTKAGEEISPFHPA
jgi:hypothetical protein